MRGRILALAGVIAVLSVALAAPAAPGQTCPTIEEVRSSLTGEVLADGLVRLDARVREGDPLVFVRTATKPREVAARAKVSGTVIDVLVRPQQIITLGTAVARICRT
ncbi:MAG: hypothetical protein HY660_06500 [Armatimonadetes bacterium]|nr:hypothetical protein [Armatimonadota bacterium]